jgi:hypothetical protein
VLSFEGKVRAQDPQYTRAAIDTYAQELKERFMLSEAPAGLFSENGDIIPHPSLEHDEPAAVDPFAVYRAPAIRAVRNNTQIQTYLQGNGAAWGYVKKVILDAMPPDVDEADDLAYDLVRPVLDEILGERDVQWETYQGESQRGTTTYIRRKQQA